MPDPINRDGAGVDLSRRFVASTTVVASPAAASETIIAQTAAVAGNVAVISGVLLLAYAAYTVGTSGASVRLRLRQTGLAGTVVGDTGAMTGSQHGAGILSSDSVYGFDTAPAAGGQVYVLTMTVGSGAAQSTVSATAIFAVAV